MLKKKLSTLKKNKEQTKIHSFFLIVLKCMRIQIQEDGAIVPRKLLWTALP
jgi:hypothetical protein